MPHRVAGRKLSRSGSHRLSMLANLAVAVVRYERVKTTEAKAKEVRGIVDGMITTAKRGDLTARRQLISQLPREPLIVEKLMSELAEKYADRSSGFTRIVKIGERLGDAAPLVQIELV
jgi:large subunit ribosomal protein L17